MEDDTQKKGHSVALTARMTARHFEHKVHAMSWKLHDCTGLLESEQLERFELKLSVIDTRTG